MEMIEKEKVQLMINYLRLEINRNDFKDKRKIMDLINDVFDREFQ